jgi:hypothetical protein
LIEVVEVLERYRRGDEGVKRGDLLCGGDSRSKLSASGFLTSSVQ